MDFEIVPDSDQTEFPDHKETDSVDLDITEEATTDTDGNIWEDVDCVDAPQPWMAEGDPYDDRDILYQYYGDFDVIVQDPENVRGLWNDKFVGYDTGSIKECTCADWVSSGACAEQFPFEPIIVEERNKPDTPTYERKPLLGIFECDMLLTPPRQWELAWRYGADPKYNAENGKVLFPMHSYNAWTFPYAVNAHLFDIASQQLITISPEYSNAYFNGRYVFMTLRDAAKNYEEPDKNYYEPVPWSKLVYYDTVEHKYGYAWYGPDFYYGGSIHASDTYIIMSIQQLPDVSGGRVVYTKIGDWQNWKELKFMTTSSQGFIDAGFPSMVGQYVAFYNWDAEVAFCDLEKGDPGCFKVSRDDENGRMPKILDSKAVYYSAEDKTTKIFSLVKANITDPQAIKYTTIVSHDKVLDIDDIDKDFLLYGKEIDKRSNGDPLMINCFYRFSDGKSFCMDDADHDAKIPTDYSYLPGGHYLVYQSWYDLVLRDMECYCDQFPARCPYADYTPKKAKVLLQGSNERR